MRRDSPVKRRNPSGQVVWVARYTGRDGKRHIAKPTWNRGKGTFTRKADAQKAIDEAYGLSDRPDTLGDYVATWTERHPRSERTNATNDHRLSRVADVVIEGIPLKDWPLRELRRRHTLALVDHMLRTEGRATTGAVGILRALSAMAEDAITDEVCDLNPFKGIRIRANDPRAQKKPRPIRVFTFDEMHRFAKAAGRYEAMVRVFHRLWPEAGGGAASPPRRLRRRDSPSPSHRPRGPDPRGDEDRPRGARRRPRRPGSSDPRLNARSADQPQRPRLRAALPNPARPPLARAHLLPRSLETSAGSVRARHTPSRVPAQLCHLLARRRYQ
jgi:hypothetical protein